MQISFLLFALAIGLRKISLFINIARWFITIESFKLQGSNQSDDGLFKGDIETSTYSERSLIEENKRAQTQNNKSTARIKVILCILIALHLALLLSLVVLENKDKVL